MSRSHSDESSREEEEKEEEYRRRRKRTKKKRRRDDNSSGGEGISDDDRRRRKRGHKSTSRHKHDEEEDESSEEDRKRRRKRKRSSSKKRRKKKKSSRRKRLQSSSPSDDGSSDDDDDARQPRKKVVNQRLLAKLEARGETLEEREERRAQRRAARISAATGYTAEDNPFNDPNLHETFTWKKKQEADAGKGKKTESSRQAKQDHIFAEIDKVRRRRQEREDHFEELERIRAEESRMKELENYDEWARKEEEFHLQQQRQRSAIRLVEGREKPVDVLAKNLLMFGLSEEDRRNSAAVKYEEKYNAMNELTNLEAELQEPHEFLKVLKLDELGELLVDIETFRKLEREAVGGYGSHESPIIAFWDNLMAVTKNEIAFLRAGGENGSRAATIADINKLFVGQSLQELLKMRNEVGSKVRRSAVASFDPQSGGVVDVEYWKTVSEQLDVHLAKMALSEFHSKMLVRQLEHLEKRKLELDKESADNKKESIGDGGEDDKEDEQQTKRPNNVEEGFGDLEEELGLTDEVAAQGAASYAWEDRFRPRKPRYFNRVKTGYDWNKYNQTHYDHDNPPPKSVQGYKFNIFYPDLIDKSKTPQFVLEPADSDDFCILRFKAGPPYEDIAFKIINREWNRSRKRGFRCSFERGVLSLYFNFKTHWYRR